MKRPFCNIDGIKHQLYLVNNVIRFMDDGRIQPDLNKMIVDYYHGDISLHELFDYHIHSGSSYELVHGVFSKNGFNNHIVTQGAGKLKSFRLYV